MTSPVVRMEQVHKRIGDQVIVEDMNLTAGRGTVIALCGGNGAGKSTILRMLAGIIRPTSGIIEVCGVRWTDDRRAYAGNIGYMPDDYRFSAGLTALETLSFWAGLKGLTRQDARRALAEVGLEHTGKKPVTAFSKGMRQRLLFAQAMIANPPLVLMDEPTNGLDPYWMDSFVGLVRNAAKRGQTVIFSTHQLQIAEALADEIYFLENGVVKMSGTLEQIRGQMGAAGFTDALARLYGLTGLRRQDAVERGK